MSMRIGLALLLVFILSGEAVSQNDPLPPHPEAGNILIAGTQQVTPGPPVTLPKTDVPRTPALPKTPSVTKPPSGGIQLNPQLVAVQKMLELARQMDHQMNLYYREIEKLRTDPNMMKNPVIKARVESIMGTNVPTLDLLIKTQDLLVDMMALNQRGTK